MTSCFAPVVHAPLGLVGLGEDPSTLLAANQNSCVPEATGSVSEHEPDPDPTNAATLFNIAVWSTLYLLRLLQSTVYLFNRTFSRFHSYHAA
jgi:hypothetical protein